MTRTRRHHRALRGAAAAWVATIIAATSHTLAGGGAPTLALVVSLAVLVSPIAVLLVGRTLSVWRVGATVLASQAAFHTAFAFTAAAVPSQSSSVHAGHVMLSVDALGGATVVAPDAAMLAGHVIAAIVTMAVLYGGERMARSIGRGIRSILARAHEIAPIGHVRMPVISVAPAGFGTGDTDLSDASRRGPPVFVTAAL